LHLQGKLLNDAIQAAIGLVRCELDVPADVSAGNLNKADDRRVGRGTDDCEARFGSMAGTTRGMKATTVI
jgi:hypothetical protein